MSLLNNGCIICKTVEKFMAAGLQVGPSCLGFIAEKQ